MWVEYACELTTRAEETACKKKKKSPVEPLMDVNGTLLLSSALLFEMVRKEKNENIRVT